MGVVYRATDLTLGRHVALKFLPPRLHADPEARERLWQEARAASALEHPNVASVYEVGEAADGRLFIAMACYDGATLKKRTAAGPLPLDEAVEIARQIAEGLASAHRAGIVHRDVKPANVMVTDEGRAIVLDFGIAQTGSDGATAGSSSGTVMYMSPEQTSGAPTDERTDVWGLGATLYEMLSGRRAFGGPYAAAARYAVAHEPHAPLDGVPPPLAAIVDRCLAKDPADRYPDAAAVAAALRDLRGERRGPGLLPTGRRARAVLWARRLPRVAQAGLALAVVVGLVGVALLGQWAWRQVRPGVAEAQTLAVLPFTTLGGGDEAALVSAGLLETLTSQLSLIAPSDGSLGVIPASEITAELTPSQAREQLGATFVVTGTIQFAEDRTRVTLNLIDTELRRQVASRPVDHLSNGALALQDLAVRQLAQMLRMNIGLADQERLSAGRTDDAEANALYIRGRGALRNGDAEEAASLFRRAIDRDARFALAHAALGETLWDLYERTQSVDYAEQAVRASQRALELDDGLAQVHISLGIIHAGREEYAQALDALDHALDLDPSSAEAARLRAGVLADQDRDVEAEEAYLAAIALDPDSPRVYNSLGVFYYFNGRNDEAIETYQTGLNLAPYNPRLLNSLAAAYWQAGRFTEAIEVFERLRRVDPDHESATLNLATARFYLGDFAEAAALYEEQLDRHPDQYMTRQYLGDALWWAPGRRDDARAAYRQSVQSAWEHLPVARTPDVIGTLASAYAKLGIRDSSLTYLRELRSAQPPEAVPEEIALGIGEIYEILGNRSEAHRWIQSALDRGVGRVELNHSPWLADIRPSFSSHSL